MLPLPYNPERVLVTDMIRTPLYYCIVSVIVVEEATRNAAVTVNVTRSKRDALS